MEQFLIALFVAAFYDAVKKEGPLYSAIAYVRKSLNSQSTTAREMEAGMFRRLWEDSKMQELYSNIEMAKSAEEKEQFGIDLVKRAYILGYEEISPALQKLYSELKKLPKGYVKNTYEQSMNLVLAREVLGKVTILEEGIKALQTKDRGYIISVGSGSGEYIFSLDSKLGLGGKYKATCSQSIGGSGVDYTLRLLNAGFPVVPILYIGKDEVGHKIQREILRAAKDCKISGEVMSFIDSDEFFLEGIRTPRPTIIIERDTERRTILVEAEEVTGSKRFREYLRTRLDYLRKMGINIGAVMIGHIYSDDIDEGQSTKYIIESLHDVRFVFANFGSSQIKLGANFWENELRDLDVLQLNLSEMRRFISETGQAKSLFGIVNWLKEKKITAIITLHKYGAIGTYKDDKDLIVLAWPLQFEHIVDTTGAGDAFGAGLVSELYQSSKLSTAIISDAISEARVWAAYACMASGGAGSPDIGYREFRQKFSERASNTIETRHIGSTRQILDLIDLFYGESYDEY